MKKSCKYNAHSKWIILEVTKKGLTEGGLVMPDVSAEHTLKIVNVGPDVTSLEVGQEVWCIGVVDQTIIKLHDNYLCTPADCVVAVRKEDI